MKFKIVKCKIFPDRNFEIEIFENCRIYLFEKIFNVCDVEILKYLQMTQEQMDKMAKGLRKSCLQKIDISEGEWKKKDKRNGQI